MRILVTGGAGFIGSHVVARYIEMGHRVTVLDDLSIGRSENLIEGAELVQLDIRDDDGLRQLFHRERFDLVNHHAAQMDVRRSVADPAFDAAVNILGSLNLLQNCIQHEVNQFIFTSSGGVIYGEADPEKIPLTERAVKRPISPYGVSKLAVEHYLYHYRINHGLRYVSLRYANVYGPRQDPHGEAGVVAIFIGQMLNGARPTIFGNGEQLRDYIYVKDVVATNMLATARLDALNEDPVNSIDDLAFNIGTGRATSVNGLFETVSRILSYRDPPRYGNPRSGEIQRNALNITKAKQQLGYRPEYDLETGLRETVRWVQAHKISVER
ncbi:MAG: NAD-dependent epimerase/dehydratase family protein [Candidatus Bipolaricaulia bacterium]